jgi:hypothetical protein
MPVVDDLRRLSQLDSIYLGYLVNGLGQTVTSWYKGRLQQANDGAWIFRSISTDGTVCGFQLGPAQASWVSNEAPNTGIQVSFPIFSPINLINLQISVLLQQQLPQELTN